MMLRKEKTTLQLAFSRICLASLLIFGLSILFSVEYVNANADRTTLTVNCRDGSTALAQRQGSAWTVEDYERACRNNGGYQSDTSGTGSRELDDWLKDIVNILSLMVGLVVVFSIVVAGIQYMTAGGNASQVAAAKNRLSMAVLSFVLFAFAFALLQWLVPGGILN